MKPQTNQILCELEREPKKRYKPYRIGRYHRQEAAKDKKDSFLRDGVLRGYISTYKVDNLLF
jgi:hypothetical protein